MTGFTYTIAIDDTIARKVLKDTRQRGEDMTPLMDEIGSIVVASTIERFETGTAPDGTPWKPSKRALETGTLTLVESGDLRRFIIYNASADQVDIGVPGNVIYAAIHQFGGKAGRNHAVNIPARPYLGIDAGDRVEIEHAVVQHIGRLS